MRRSILPLLLLSMTGVLFAAEKPKPVATVGRTVITEEEVNREIGNRLLKIRTEEYNIRRGVLETIIEDKLLADEAAKRHVTVDELVRTEIESKVQTPSQAEIQPFYEASRDRFSGLSPDAAMQQIAENMRGRNIAKRRTEFVDSLRSAAGVKVLLEPPRAAVEAVGPSRGGANAPVTIVEFSDFECPACSRANPTVQKLTDAYGDKIRFVHRDFPLAMHRGAPRAAEAAHCAGEQEQYWPMHDKLFSRGGGSLSDTDIKKFALDLGLDIGKFDACLGSGKYTETWKASQAEGNRIGVVSTPTFFINGRMIAGAAPYEIFARAVDEELANRAVMTASK